MVLLWMDRNKDPAGCPYSYTAVQMFPPRAGAQLPHLKRTGPCADEERFRSQSKPFLHGGKISAFSKGLQIILVAVTDAKQKTGGLPSHGTEGHAI